MDYVFFQDLAWKVNANPLDPDSGWRTHVSSLVFPLIGVNVTIVPEKSIGYKMDHTCDASTWNNNAYSYTDISNLLHRKATSSTAAHYSASVYCFVSDEFDGTWVNISVEGDETGNIIDEYDLNQKGKWQKLQIDFETKVGVPPVYLYWSKFGVTDFSTLKGYVIFAYPQYEQVIINNPNTFVKSAPKQSPAHIYYPIQSGQLLSIIQILNPQTSSIQDRDFIRKWTSKIVSEDTTYYSYKNKLLIDSITNNFIAPRLIRWQFACQIFAKEYNGWQKLVGGGFNYLNWYGYHFLKDKTASDYPHNPFLSILLYSGLIGLFLYTLFIFRIFLYYYKYIKSYFMFFIFFLITLFFSFFSAGSPFDPPIMGFFSILPFFLHQINRNKD